MALQSEVVALDSRLVGIAGHPDIVGYLGIAAVRVVGRLLHLRAHRLCETGRMAQQCHNTLIGFDTHLVQAGRALAMFLPCQLSKPIVFSLGTAALVMIESCRPF